MSAADKQGQGIPFNVELTRKEYDLLLLGAKKWKQTPQAHVRWLIEKSGLGFYRYDEEGAAARSLLRASESEVHYPDSVSVSMTPIDDKD